MSRALIRKALKEHPDGLTGTEKFCKKCEIVTPCDSRNRCKPCRASLQRNWVANNKDKKKAMDAAYSEANKEKIKTYKAAYHLKNIEKARANYSNWKLVEGNTQKASERSRDWYQANKTRARVARRAWLSANTEKSKAMKEKWKRANLDYCRVIEHVRRAKKKNSGGIHTVGDIKKLLALQKNKCAVCKKSLSAGYHIDHIMPLALGGSNWPENLQMLCPKCNLKKRAKHPIDFMQERGFLL